MASATNERVAGKLEEAATLLEQQGGNPFRAKAYRRAAEGVAALTEDLARIVERDGVDALEQIPGVGTGIAAAIRELLATGRWSQLERLRGALDPVALFATVPGVGPSLARAIHDELHVETLEALEAAAHDGRLAAVPGIGTRRLALVKAGLAARLAGLRPRIVDRGAAPHPRPEVALLLAVDEEYRRRAAAGELRRIAPKRFNPGGEAWLPVLHATRDGWHFTALFSNTARAHELGRTHDWVVIYFYDHDHREDQCTVVTEGAGELAGRRVVRGRESECRAHYGLSRQRRAG